MRLVLASLTLGTVLDCINSGVVIYYNYKLEKYQSNFFFKNYLSVNWLKNIIY